MLDDERDDYLLDLLTRIREIAALENSEAFAELIGLVREIQAGGNYELEHAREVLAQIKDDAKHFANVVERGVPVDNWWTGRQFMERVDELGRRWSSELREQVAGDIAETQHIARPIARAAAAYGATSMIKEFATAPIANPQEAGRMLRDLAAAEELLTRLGSNEGSVAHSLRAAREHVVRDRWRRRMEEAEVAAAGGNAKKATKLRAEAHVLLQQDWTRVFPSESPPET